MISVEGLTVEFSSKPLFSNANFVVNDRDRVALVGKNGAGKSTLLKLICGIMQPTSGCISMPNGTTVGYLPQVMQLQDDTTVRQDTRKAFASHISLKKKSEDFYELMNINMGLEQEMNQLKIYYSQFNKNQMDLLIKLKPY